MVFNWRYPDVDMWSPEEVLSFQDAIYKTEKDFHQVAQEVCLSYQREASSIIACTVTHSWAFSSEIRL